MSLAHGRSYLAIPGPSVIPDEVLRSMHRAAPNIYKGELVEMMPGILGDLRKVARTDGHVAIYIANGHGAWEAALSNTLSRGDKVLVLASGRFGHGWAEVARHMGIDAEVIDFGRHAPADPARLSERLREPDAGMIRAVLVCHVDTSTSVRSDIAALRDALDGAGHPALLLVDAIASLACDRLEMDAWGADVLLTGSQKGLMTPPGLGIVFFNERADRARDRADCVTPYWDWRPRIAPDIFYQYFFGTAPTHHLYGLRTALDMIHAEGIDAVWQRHETLASAIWAATETWSDGGALSLNVADSEYRAHSVTAIAVGSDKGEALRDWCEQKAGLTLGIGLGMEPSSHFFRIGHMGHVNASMILGAISTIEAGMTAVGIPHGKGGGEAAALVVAAKA